MTLVTNSRNLTTRLHQPKSFGSPYAISPLPKWKLNNNAHAWEPRPLVWPRYGCRGERKPRRSGRCEHSVPTAVSPAAQPFTDLHPRQVLVCVRYGGVAPEALARLTIIICRLGGPDPLDYISIYNNEGDSRLSAPPHWHYVSSGLSDLYGDRRVHEWAQPVAVS